MNSLQTALCGLEPCSQKLMATRGLMLVSLVMLASCLLKPPTVLADAPRVGQGSSEAPYCIYCSAGGTRIACNVAGESGQVSIK
jgi:hypothetical protein